MFSERKHLPNFVRNREALHALSHFQSRQVRSTAWKCNLEIGSGLTIPICLYTRVCFTWAALTYSVIHEQEGTTQLFAECGQWKMDILLQQIAAHVSLSKLTWPCSDGFTDVSRKVIFPERRFPERRFPDSHFPGKTFPGKKTLCLSFSW